MKRIESIDGLRALSISLVLLGHLLNGMKSHVRINHWWFLLGNGGLGVFIFFVISGYLITKLLLRENEKFGTISLSRFYYRRFFRIIPPLYMYVAFVFIVGIFTGLRAEPREIFTALTFTRNLDYHSHQFMFEHFWSLCIEEQFYLIWPILLLICLRRSGPKAAATLAMALIIIAPVYRLMWFPLIHDQPFRHFVDELLPGRMDALMFGCLVALTEGAPALERIYNRVSSVPWILPVWFFLISNLLSSRFGNYYTFAIGQTLDGAAVALMLLWCARNPRSGVGRVLNWGPVVHVGLISYSLYIWQTYFLHEKNYLIVGHFPLNLICIFAAAEFSYYGIERLSRIAKDTCEPLLFKRPRRVQLVPESETVLESAGS